MGILDVKIVQDYIRMCTDGWKQGWHERNGGNLTYRMRPEEVEQCRLYFRTAGEWVSMGVTGKNLAGEYFLTTGSGKYFRNVALDPAHNIGIVEIDSAGGAWRIVWGLEDGAKPTSEFPSHFMNHSVRAAATEGVYRVIYHAHTPNLIAMTYVLPLMARGFHPCLVAERHRMPGGFPGRCGRRTLDGAGGADIAIATSELMKQYDAAVWAHHGLFCSGPDFDTTLRLDAYH